MRFMRLYFMAVLLLLGCDKPKAPSFLADIEIPLFKNKYDYRDIDGKGYSADTTATGDTVLVDIDRTEPFTVKDNLKADPTNHTTAGTINNDLRIRDSVTTNYSLGLLAPPGVDALHNTTAVIPGFVIPNTSKNINFPTFTSVTAYTGTLRVVVTNNTQVTDTALYVVVFNSSNGVRLDSFKLTTLTTGSSQTHTRTFFAPADTIAITPITVRVSGGSSGSVGSVLVDTSRAVSVKTVFDITASSITGLFPAQTIIKNDSVQSNSNSTIDTAVISSGKIDFRVTRKSLTVSSTVTITSSDFIKPGGGQLDTFITMPANGTFLIKSVNLTGYRFRPSGYDIGLNKQYARYTATIVTSASGSSSTIANGHGDTIKVSVDTLKFGKVVGILNNENVNISQRTKDVSIKYLDSIVINSAYLLITTEHQIQFPVTSLNLNISGTRGGSTVTLPTINGSMNAWTGGPPQRDTIYSVTGVKSLLSLLPNTLTFSGNAIVGDGTTSGSILSTDSFKVKVSLRAPLIFKLPNDTTKNIIQPDPHSLGMGDTLKQRLHDKLLGVTIRATIKNHFPVPVSIRFFVDSVSQPVPFYNTPSAFKFVYPYMPLTINKGTTDPITGLVTASNDTTITYTLTPAEYQRIFVPGVPIYGGFKARLLGTGAGFVQITTRDFLNVDAHIEIEFLIDEDLLN